MIKKCVNNLENNKIKISFTVKMYNQDKQTKQYKQCKQYQDNQPTQWQLKKRIWSIQIQMQVHKIISNKI